MAGVESRGKPGTPAEGLRLVKASLEPPAGLTEFLRDVSGDRFGFRDEDEVASGEMTLDGFLQNRADWSAGVNLSDDWVPFTTFWLLDSAGSVVGTSRLRHSLNDFLLEHGGHIGYYVARAQRRKGYATRMLALTLAEARNLGITRALLTVDSDNEASIRVIERNGGILEDEGIDGTTGKLHRRYWIPLP